MSNKSSNVFHNLRKYKVPETRAKGLAKTMEGNGTIRKGLEEYFLRKCLFEFGKFNTADRAEETAIRARVLREVASDLGIDIKKLLDNI